MATSGPLVLVVGGTGRTGKSIVTGLLKHGKFRVAVLTRPVSANKPYIKELAAKGVEIRIGDISTDGHAKLVEILQGVDVLISAIYAGLIHDQRKLFAAAKDVNPNVRVVPDDWATYTPRGIRQLADDKYAIHDYIEELGLPHTYIDVGWWMQITVPGKVPGFELDTAWTFYGDGDKKFAVTDLNHIGDFVARIIEDPRTLNQWVYIWEDELTQAEAWATATRVLGSGWLQETVQVSADELLQRATEFRAKYRENPDLTSLYGLAVAEYAYSIHIRGDNNIATAKAAGALDARELYPDIRVSTFEEFLRRVHGKREENS
ncbi:NAD(P)-binding protein [Punctularia strigosozonata HHB-11173 SS5]|uniref:NAD(P)-binding protein n=1 Tax=Punctularia strigosozonata (strain HHB-11173) TaxID=741275 RepID=R7S1G2_PUNST|nr:NAD(P)-binding protein [Punctularia strigosozonata HHB-11173 SS5]EIN04063.1 NAD(P)-binding protein [Punctularia strigosozonata HHB-11173 SS5]